jgi:hypothetical protein
MSFCYYQYRVEGKVVDVLKALAMGLLGMYVARVFEWVASGVKGRI